MRSKPTDADDNKELERLNAEPWMVECLSLNPGYVHWGPGEDYMTTRGEGWDASKVFATWSAFGPWGLNDLNEVVNFYFTIERAAVNCDACDGEGLNPETKKIGDAFYDFEQRGVRWCDAITQDEADALAERGRIPKGTSAANVNAANVRPGLGGMSHDAINRWILIDTRAKRLGVYGKCDACEGHGSVFTEPAAKLGLVMWYLHPRKGCSRGVQVNEIRREELPTALAFLKSAAERNAARFAKVVALAP